MHRGPLGELVDCTAGLHDGHQDQSSYTGHDHVQLDVQLLTVVAASLALVFFGASCLT